MIFTAATSSNIDKANTTISEDQKRTTINVNLENPNDQVMIDFTIKNSGYYQVIIDSLVINNKVKDIQIEVVDSINRLGTPLLVGETIPCSINITSKTKVITNFETSIAYTPLKNNHK